jgi:uncharacterized membrane-anchored protein YhcB (DUF1043 family)
MSKKIEEYIREHKKSFDIDGPSANLWSRIETSLDNEKVKKPWRVPLWLSIAASLIVVMTFTFIFTYRNRPVDIADLNPAYARKEMKFASLIEEKKDSLQVYAKENPELCSQFNADLEKLGRDYENLKKELQNSPNQKIVVKAMVRNLETQLQIINQQLSIVNEVTQYKKENRI